VVGVVVVVDVDVDCDTGVCGGCFGCDFDPCTNGVCTGVDDVCFCTEILLLCCNVAAPWGVGGFKVLWGAGGKGGGVVVVVAIVCDMLE
jgi:hypothetical protein